MMPDMTLVQEVRTGSDEGNEGERPTPDRNRTRWDGASGRQGQAGQETHEKDT